MTKTVADTASDEQAVSVIRRAWNAVAHALTMEREGEVEVATVEEATRTLWVALDDILPKCEIDPAVALLYRGLEDDHRALQRA